MTASAAIDSFLAGAIGFERLAQDLAVSGSPSEVAATLADYVNTGRLPVDVAELLRRRLAAATAPAVSPAASLTALGGRVEDVVTEALAADFRRFRDRARTPAAERPDGRLDVLLREFRGLRLRREAHRIASGERAVPAEGGGLRLPVEPAIEPGEMLKDRFVLDELLGRGGMGSVFRCVDRRRLEALDPQPYVAVKVLSPDFRRHPDALRAIEAEARRAQSLAHPNICAVFDFDRDGGHAFIVMELLEGETLDAALRAAPDGRLPPERRAAVLGGLLAAMAHAHAHGVVHADLKPGNVFLVGDGTTKVLDFGVASAAGAGFDPTALRAITPGYSSPEMALGAPRDPRDDVFALAVVGYLVIAGRHPYDRRPAEEAAAQGLRPEPLQGETAALWNALAPALSLERADRPADAGAFAARLLPALGAG